jgi:putative membrane-bound dehydrogenase-like protein
MKNSSRAFPFAMAFAVITSVASVQAQVSPDETLKSFELAEGLEATVWSTEPMLVNPTNIDIDARGRVWVAEGANYRSTMTRPEGDRIVILEDTDHDGKADSQKVFVQDRSLSSPLGIAVIGNKVYVSLSPNIYVYTIDETGDKPVGKPEIWMTGFEGVNHDHGVHAITFGPDGRFYFNAGNSGCEAKEPFKLGNGTPVVDSAGSDVPRGAMWRGAPQPKGTIGYQQGMAFRCNPDGGGFEVLGHNFRNNYELAVDSFGTVWQSDNDDDGNESVRINFVMEGGDYGYHGPKGHDWNRDSAAFPAQSRQEAHWHQRWPGVVPNLLNTGGGSPTGMVIYEGDLLPEKLRGAMIHCDPGQNVVRAYIPKRSAQVPVKKFDEPEALKGPARDGAGYTAEVVNLITGKDKWFRPSDVCVAADGSLLVADWYDPGVGGHQTADLKKEEPQDWRNLRGRIYRVAPKGHKPSPVKLDLKTVDGQVAALKSPNLATRALAFARLRNGGEPAENALAKLATSDEAPRYRARAIWLAAHGQNGAKLLFDTLHDANPDIVITALRAARFVGMDLTGLADHIIGAKPAPAVLREMALAMNYQPAAKAVPVLVKLANEFDGEDRWYLEAIGIGATGKEQAVLEAWEAAGTNKDGEAGDLIRWRLKKELPEQVRLDDKTHVIAGWWMIGPFDAKELDDPLGTEFGPERSPVSIDPKVVMTGLDQQELTWQRIDAGPFDSSYADLRGVNFQELLRARKMRTERVVGYFATTITSSIAQPAKLLIASNDGCRAWLNGQEVVRSKKPYRAMKLFNDTVTVDLREGENVLFIKLFQSIADSGLVVAVRGEKEKVSESTTSVSGPEAPSNASDAVMKSKDGSALPSIDELVKQIGDPKAGESVFAISATAKCITCHQVGTKGQMLGPPLTTIGQKLSKAQLYEAILKPNAGILMGYENWVVKTKKGQIISGLKTSETADAITLKDTLGKYHDIATEDIARQVKQKISLMPENVAEAMTQQELVDLVEYLSTLRNK